MILKEKWLGARHAGAGARRGGQPTALPPSTETTWPVTNEAEAEARKTIARAISSGLPIRPSALERRGFGDAFDGVLAADIDRGTGGTLMTVGRGDVDDAAALLRRHHAQLMFQAEQHAEHIGVEGGGVALGGLIDDQARLALGTGIVDGGIDPAEAGHGLIDQVAHLVFVTDVGLDERGFGAQAAKFGLESLAFGLPAAGDDEAGAVLGEGDGGGATYACEGSSDQNDWLFHGVAPQAVAGPRWADPSA